MLKLSKGLLVLGMVLILSVGNLAAAEPQPSTQVGIFGELLTTDCNGFAHVLPNFPNGYLVLSEAATVFDMAYEAMFDKINEHCDLSEEDFDHYMTISPEYIMMLLVTGKMEGRPICEPGSSWDLRLAIPYFALVQVRYLRDFQDFDVLPESCSMESLARGDGCLFQVNVMEKLNELTEDLFELDELNIAFAIDSCPSDSPSNLFFSVVCTSPACEKLFAPCDRNSECGDGLSCADFEELSTEDADNGLREILSATGFAFNIEEDPEMCIGEEVEFTLDLKNWIRTRFYGLPASDRTTVGFCSPIDEDIIMDIAEEIFSGDDGYDYYDGEDWEDEWYEDEWNEDEWEDEWYEDEWEDEWYDDEWDDEWYDEWYNEWEDEWYDDEWYYNDGEEDWEDDGYYVHRRHLLNHEDYEEDYYYEEEYYEEFSILEILDDILVSWDGELSSGHVLDENRKSGFDLPYAKDVLAAMDPDLFEASNLLTVTCDMAFMTSRPLPKAVHYSPHLKPAINALTDALARIQNCRSPNSAPDLTPEQFAIRFLPFHIEFFMYQLFESDTLDNFHLGKNLEGDLFSVLDLERSSIMDGSLVRMPETGTYEYWKEKGQWGLKYSGLSNYIGQELNIKLAAIECPVPDEYSDTIMTMPAYSLRLDGAMMDRLLNPRGCERDSDCDTDYEVCQEFNEDYVDDIDLLTTFMFPKVNFRQGNYDDYEFGESIDYVNFFDSRKRKDPEAFLHFVKDIASTLFLQQPLDASLDEHPHSLCIPKLDNILSDDEENDYLSEEIFFEWLENQMTTDGSSISFGQLESMSKEEMDEMTASMIVPEATQESFTLSPGAIVGIVIGGCAVLGISVVLKKNKKRKTSPHGQTKTMAPMQPGMMQPQMVMQQPGMMQAYPPQQVPVVSGVPVMMQQGYQTQQPMVPAMMMQPKVV